MFQDLKVQLADRIPTFGTWLSLGHCSIAEILADAGFDWLVVDLEHSAITIGEAEALIRVVDLKGKTPLVRLTENDCAQIKRVMDAGAGGVIVPMVRTRDQAESAVSAVKYPPAGKRGVGLGRAQAFGPGFDEYASTVNASSVVIAQIEHHEGVSRLEEILAVEGIDGTIIGPYDLSASVGRPGQFQDPQVRQLMDRYEKTCLRLDKPMGFHVVPPDHRLVLEKLDRGYTFLALSTDFLFLGDTARRELSLVRSGAQRGTERRT